MDQLKVVQEVLADLKISLSYLASFSTVSKKTTLTGRLLICILPDAVHGPVRTKSDEHHRSDAVTARNKKQLGIKTSEY